MLFAALEDSPNTITPSKERLAELARLDSGIGLDIGLGNRFCPEDFLAVRKGDVFRSMEEPIQKKLIFVERISENEQIDESCDEVFRLDLNANKDVVMGYIPANAVALKEDVLDSFTSSNLYDSQGCQCELQQTKSNDSLIKKLQAENSQLKAQILELKITNGSLVDSLSWNGDDDLGMSHHLQVFESPRSPRLLRSPRALRSRSRTIRSDCSDAETDAFFKVLEFSKEKTEDFEEQDIMLSCTLCSRKIKMKELEIHSKVCSSAAAHVSPTPKVPNVLVANVTQVTLSSCTEQLLKVITKTTIDVYDGHFFEVNRTIADFLWFKEALQNCCPSRIVPCITLHGNVNGNFREIQRFLRRLTSHEALKPHDFVRLFLTGKDLEDLKQQYEHKNLKRTTSTPLLPNNSLVDKNSLLYRSEMYIASLLESLENLTDYMRENMNKDIVSDEISNMFRSLSDVEMKETYLKIATSGLSRITQETASDEEESYEAALVEELESVIGNIKEAQKLLERVKMKMNTFLYWEEQMKIYEQHTDKKEANADGRASWTKHWAEASANCISAKSSLENICKYVSKELTNFDIFKEQDLKEILMDFADGKFHHYEKLQSKWYGVRIMLDADIMPSNRAFDMS